MKARCIVFIFLFQAIMGFAATQDILNYLKPILQEELTSAGDAWTYSGHGGYLFRFDLDITGDRRPEVFLISSLNLQKFYGPWQVFKTLPDGRLHPYAEPLNLNPQGFWLRKTNTGTAIVRSFHDRWSNDEKRDVLETTNFVGDHIVTEESRFMDDPTQELQAQGKIASYTPDVSGVLLADFLKDPKNAKWIHIDFDHPAPNPLDYFVQTNDVERVKGLTYFTPELAWKWLGEEKGHGVNMETDPSATVLTSTPTLNSTESGKVSIEHRSWPMVLSLAGTILFFASGYVLFLWLRMRKKKIGLRLRVFTGSQPCLWPASQKSIQCYWIGRGKNAGAPPHRYRRAELLRPIFQTVQCQWANSQESV